MLGIVFIAFIVNSLPPPRLFAFCGGGGVINAWMIMQMVVRGTDKLRILGIDTQTVGALPSNNWNQQMSSSRQTFCLLWVYSNKTFSGAATVC